MSLVSAMTAVGVATRARLENLDPVPEPTEVTAGLLGLVVFLGLILALAVLLFAMSRQLKRVSRNNAEGRYDDLPDRRRAPRRGDGQEPPLG